MLAGDLRDAEAVFSRCFLRDRVDQFDFAVHFRTKRIANQILDLPAAFGAELAPGNHSQPESANVLLHDLDLSGPANVEREILG